MATSLAHLITQHHRAWRRARHLSAPFPWALLGTGLFVIAGGLLIGWHARRLEAGATEAGGDALRAAAVFQPILPGASVEVPASPGVRMLAQPGGALVIVSGMQPAEPVRVDLCTQLDVSGRLLPLRIGERFANPPPMGRNVLLAANAMPQVRLTGSPAQLRAAWTGQPARWLGDGGEGIVQGAGSAALKSEGWLAWEGGALHLVRRASTACPRAGELFARLYAAAQASGRAHVSAFAAVGAVANAWLAPGRYTVPAAIAPALEDEALFAALQSYGLVRLDEQGNIVLAPSDLPEWRTAAPSQRADDLSMWLGARLDDEGRKLLRRLYRQADGAYVRQQVALYNSERALLAWRVRSGDASRWRTDGDTTSSMPPLAARLTRELPQGWQPWTRLAAPGRTARLTLDRPRGGTLSLLVAGRVEAVEGATVQSRAACDGRACASPSDVQELRLTPNPGADRIVLTLSPLDAGALARDGDRRYRHLQVVANRIVWQPLPRQSAPVQGRAGASVQLLADRNGTPLWSDGATSAAAADAGLAPLLGLGPEHAASIAGMLARADASRATLTLDLPLQQLAQRALDCLGLRHGRLDGDACDGGSVPAHRKAGIVVLDAENGDILAAAGAGQPRVDAGNWREARDLDRASPADSPLRLPALQHDGGAHSSPGSTFKVVSALGLERAARDDPALDALLGGQALPELNALARSRGYDFTTGAPTYPASARGAYVTNYKEVGIDGRAQQGRLGLAQAMTYSLNTWFAWTAEMADATLLGRAEGGMPDMQALEPGALDAARPIVGAARRLGFERAQRLDGGLLPPSFRWGDYDALLATPGHIDPVRTRHEVRQMSIGLRMQATPLQMALAAAAVGQGATVAPRLLLELDGRAADRPRPERLDERLDRIRAGMRGVIDRGTGAGAFRALPASVRAGLYGKTGTAPVADGLATVWFTGWLEPGTLPGQQHRLAFAVYVSHSEGTGGEHAAPVVAALLARLAQSAEQKAK